MQKLNKQIPEEEIAQTIKKFDTNNDGEIDRQEFDRLFKLESRTPTIEKIASILEEHDEDDD